MGLARAHDGEVWARPARLGLTIVSKDADFHQRSFTLGPPPKVIWVRLGNCSTDDILRLLRDHAVRIEDFGRDPAAAFLSLR
jgi:predicted nuclease of predicted toxin-antitoxin system